MSERPIIFSGPMVRAILDGRKTQTRRVLKHPHSPSDYEGARFHDVGAWQLKVPRFNVYQPVKVPYAPGDRLWVRETHALVPATAYRMSEGVEQTTHPDDPDMAAVYRCDWERSTSGIRWRPSIHMPRWASRITLEVTDVRVQRLQEISDADALAEGVEVQDDGFPICTPRKWFEVLWQSIHGPGAWDENPWVVAVSFAPFPAPSPCTGEVR